MKAFQTPAPHITRADVPLPELKQQIAELVERQSIDRAVDRLRWLLAEQSHQLDPADAAFAALACACPDGCSCETDYPGWTPGVRPTAPKEAS